MLELSNLWANRDLPLHVLRWRLTWNRYDPDYVPPGLSDRFISARAAAARVVDGATVVSTGMAGNHRASAFYWALRDRHRETGHPAGLTWCGVGALGARSKAPGTLEELDAPGLVTTSIFGHHETVRAFLRVAETGAMEIHGIPIGIYAFLLETQAHQERPGASEWTTEVGLGTFLDPRRGPGTPVTPGATRQLVEVVTTPEGERLRYHLPKLEVALISAPYADRDGNIYVRDACCLTEIRDAARAVHRNGGEVLVAVADIIDPVPGQDVPYIPADQVSGIVVHRRNEQTVSVPQRRSWPMFTLGHRVDTEQAVRRADLLNFTLGIAARRTPADEALGRLTASIMAAHLRAGDLVNIGTGLPEQAGHMLHLAGLGQHLVETTETGVIGGVPASGIFFGAAIAPDAMVSSAEIFHRYDEELALTCLGLLEVDSAGDVNLSRRGPDPLQVVGAGGAPNILAAAPVIVFSGAFATGARYRIEHGRLVVERAGTPKFVDRVREVTFSAARAREQGRTVHYVTHLGAFELGPNGLVLTDVMPGVDIDRDILGPATAAIALPEGGRGAVRVVPDPIVTGAGFALDFGVLRAAPRPATAR